jgi:hypothetical protein
MKHFLFSLLFSTSVLFSLAQDKPVPDPAREVQTVEASCGQCKFGLPGKGCKLAVRIKDQAYFVDGSEIDSHGDAHANDGFCNAIRKAKVQGEVVNNRFQATYFELLPGPAKKAKRKS